MTPEERAKEDAWARWAAEQDDGACVSVGGLYVKLQKFPPPDVTGMTPEEEAAAVARWIEDIAQWERETVASQATDAAEPTAAPRPPEPLPAQAPVA